MIHPALRAVAICLLAWSSLAGQEAAKHDYYRKWLDEDVLWIVTEAEREVFLKLGTDEERDAFIEQFWLRRDPDPGTADNEFKIEHYRRIVYANENFTAGIAGWKSDLGMIYIKFGPPDRIETYPAGGTYYRERKEGGGRTAIFPTIRWEYRRVEGVGEDVELEFVDDKGGGLYELTFDRQRKDALLHSGNMGLTQDELEQLAMTGSTSKRDRISRTREAGELRGIYSATGGFETTRDKPLEQLRLSGAVQRSPAIKYKDLEAAVTARVSYDQLPIGAREDFIRLTEQQVLVPVTLLLSNSRLTFRKTAGIYQARVQLYGRVVTLGNRIEAVFEDEIARDIPEPDWEAARSRSSLYQRRLILKPGLYKLELVVRDLESKSMGSLERRLEVPRYPEGELRISSPVLASRIEPATGDHSGSQLLLGDLRIIPKTEDAFRSTEELGVYLQVYNYGLDPSTHRPELLAEYALSPKGTPPETWRDMSRVVKYAGSYCRLARMVSLQRLVPGDYELHIRIQDRLSQQSASTSTPFRVVSP